MKNKYIYGIGIIILAIAGYFYYSKISNQKVTEKPAVSAQPTIGPAEMESLRNDPNAPAWMKDAASCVRISGSDKIFCKLNGE